ncbi:MAG: ABC transporter ATP-binding protein [Pseudomonadota bacterium]
MLELRGVSKAFGGVKAVDTVTMSILAGEVRGLIGPNGAGKSTLVNLISGLLTHSAGTISLDGTPLDGLSTQARAKKGLARTFQNLRVFPSLTVRQNIDVASYAGAASKRGNDIVAEAILRFDLSGLLNAPASALAYGQLRRLEIVRALALRPRVLMLDEPAAGMNETETAALNTALQWVRDQSDCALLVIDHDLKFIMSLCEQITVLNLGAVIADGTPNEVTENRQVIDAYLGENHNAA